MKGKTKFPNNGEMESAKNRKTTNNLSAAVQFIEHFISMNS